MDPYLEGDLRSCASFLSLVSWEPWLTFCPCIRAMEFASGDHYVTLRVEV